MQRRRSSSKYVCVSTSSSVCVCVTYVCALVCVQLRCLHRRTYWALFRALEHDTSCTCRDGWRTRCCCICIYIYMCVHINVCVYIYIYMCVYICVCEKVCMFVCMWDVSVVYLLSFVSLYFHKQHNTRTRHNHNLHWNTHTHTYVSKNFLYLGTINSTLSLRNWLRKSESGIE